MKNNRSKKGIILAVIMVSILMTGRTAYFKKAIAVFCTGGNDPAAHMTLMDERRSPGGQKRPADGGIALLSAKAEPAGSEMAETCPAGPEEEESDPGSVPEGTTGTPPADPSLAEEAGESAAGDVQPAEEEQKPEEGQSAVPVTDPVLPENTEEEPGEESAASDPAGSRPQAEETNDEAEDAGTPAAEPSVPKYADPVPSAGSTEEDAPKEQDPEEKEVQPGDGKRVSKSASGAGVVITYALINGGGATQWYTEKSGASHSVLAKKRGSQAAYCADPHASFPSGSEWDKSDTSGKNKLFSAYSYVLANGFKTFSSYSASEYREYFITQFAMWEVQSHYKDGHNNQNGYVTLDGLSFGSNNYGGSTGGMKSEAQSLADEAIAFAERASKPAYGYAVDPTLTISPSKTKLKLNDEGTYYESGAISIKTEGASGEVSELAVSDSSGKIFDRTKNSFKVRYPASKVTEPKTFKITASVEWSLSKATVHEPVAFGNAAKPQPVVYLESVEEVHEKAAELEVTVEPEDTWLLIKKGTSSASAVFVSGNPLYSLTGTTYTVYKGDGSTAGTLVTDAAGTVAESQAVRLAPGMSYTMKETKAGPGYCLDGRTWTVSAASDGAVSVASGSDRRTVTKSGRIYTAIMEDEPVGAPGELKAVKEMRLKDGSTKQVPLPGAVYAMKFYAGETAQGTPLFAAEAVSGEDGTMVLTSSRVLNGAAAFPLGTLTLTETKAPEHMRADPNVYTARIRQSGNGAALAWETGSDLLLVRDADRGTLITVYDEGRFGGVSICKKDAETGREEPQGDANFGGITFTVRRAGEGTTWDREGRAYQAGDAVMTLTTAAEDKDGEALRYGYASSLPDDLMEGEYTIEETADNGVYRMTDGKPIPFKVEHEHVIVHAGAAENKVARGGFIFEKQDLELGEPIPLGGASLSGICFSLTNESAHPVMIYDALHPEGQLIEPGGVIPAPDGGEEFITDDKGAFGAPKDYLPVGSYAVRETKTNESYNLTAEEPVTFRVQKDGEIAGSGKDGTLSVSDRVIRGELHFRKKDENGRLMPGIPFRITHLATGETQTVYTDTNGEYHSENTWFGLSADGSRTAAKEDGMMPYVYGWYRIEEERCEANAGKELITDEFMLYREGQTVDLGTIVNQQIGIRTSAEEETSGTRVFPADRKGIIIDRVTYTGLDTSRTYILRGELHLREKGADGSVRDAGILRGGSGAGLTAEKTFRPKSGTGSVDVRFEVDRTLPAGTETVVYETLFEVRDGKELPAAAHRDPSDPGQTIRVIGAKEKKEEKETKKENITPSPAKEKEKKQEKEKPSSGKKRTSPVKTGDTQALGALLFLLILSAAAVLISAKKGRG